jgi:hypothetical protein
METINRTDFTEVYVLKTLNEIKSSVKQNIKLNPEQEKQTDEKMKQVLKDLINANFKNLQMNPKGDLIYTFLPIVDERENEKVRLSLVLYYTALYYDNVDLLHEMLKANIKFSYDWYISLQYLDKSISSKFEQNDYINNVKKLGYMLRNFARSIENLPEEKREEYIQKFAGLFKLKYEDICNTIKEYKGYGGYEPLGKLFTKSNLDTFNYDAYKNANNRQLELINFCDNEKYNEETRQRLNNLVENTDYSNCLYDFELMMKLYSDEQLSTVTRSVSNFLSGHSDTQEMLQKAIDFVNLRPDLAFYASSCVSKEKFMITSNYVLIEAMDYIFKHQWIRSSENVEHLSKILVPKVTLKKMFGAYKKRDS